MHNFVHMKMKFDEVAAFLCHGNHKIFLKDVKQRLKNLRLTLGMKYLEEREERRERRLGRGRRREEHK